MSKFLLILGGLRFIAGLKRIPALFTDLTLSMTLDYNSHNRSAIRKKLSFEPVAVNNRSQSDSKFLCWSSVSIRTNLQWCFSSQPSLQATQFDIRDEETKINGGS